MLINYHVADHKISGCYRVNVAKTCVRVRNACALIHKVEVGCRHCLTVTKIITWLDRLKMTAVHCLGCGVSLTTGRPHCSDTSKHVAHSWREITGMVLDRNNQVINQDDLFGDGSRGFMCFRAFESFQSANCKLLHILLY